MSSRVRCAHNPKVLGALARQVSRLEGSNSSPTHRAEGSRSVRFVRLRRQAAELVARDECDRRSASPVSAPQMNVWSAGRVACQYAELLRSMVVEFQGCRLRSCQHRQGPRLRGAIEGNADRLLTRTGQYR